VISILLISPPKVIYAEFFCVKDTPHFFSKLISESPCIYLFISSAVIILIYFRICVAFCIILSSINFCTALLMEISISSSSSLFIYLFIYFFDISLFQFFVGTYLLHFPKHFYFIFMVVHVFYLLWFLNENKNM
jgi:hypothetical protein